MIQSFQDIMSHTPGNLRAKIEVPDGLVIAWLHLVMALVQASASNVAWNDNMDVAEALVRKGMNDISRLIPGNIPSFTVHIERTIFTWY